MKLGKIYVSMKRQECPCISGALTVEVGRERVKQLGERNVEVPVKHLRERNVKVVSPVTTRKTDSTSGTSSAAKA